FAKAYMMILDASRDYTKGLESIFYNAQNDFTWQNTVLLAPLCVTDDQNIVRRKIAVTASYLDIWLMRRTVNYVRVGYSSSSYAMYILCKEIRNKSLPELVDILSKKLANEDVTFEGMPSKGRKGIEGLSLNQYSRRYIYHLLARLTAYTEVGAGESDQFDEYVDRKSANPYDIEHIVPDNFDLYKAAFSSEQEFEDWRNHVAGLLLLPQDVNRSIQDEQYEEKAPHSRDQNIYAASLQPATYDHRVKFRNFCQDLSLPFKPCEHFGKNEQQERRKLVLTLVNRIWSPDRLRGYL